LIVDGRRRRGGQCRRRSSIAIATSSKLVTLLYVSRFMCPTFF
jgi:hypothetical protein